MNKLVIIGNGFDLAHGLPTGYRDFIDTYWQRIPLNFDIYLQNQQYNDEFVEVYYKFNREYITVCYDIIPEIKTIENYENFHNFIYKYSKANNPNSDICDCSFNFKNDFFRIINEKNSQNWVDIENQYYYQLKKIVKSKCLDMSKSEEYWTEEQRKQVKKLNDEFDSIKNLFENYLKEKVIQEYNFDDHRNPVGDTFQFPEIFKPIFFNQNSEKLDKFLEEFPIPNQDRIRQLFTEQEDVAQYVSQLAFLNFNYTPTNNKYIESLNSFIDVKNIHIHGFVDEKRNPINFGFGDEMDDDYKIIENINDNEYLKNFKSFQYLHTSNYKNLLDFIDSESFQVYIMGHSCGLSDRTLLNTIFEHQNCISIKVFYYQKEDGTDNYTEITQNISRHFNKKKLMREKIVNKTLCQPLPQIQLPKKQNDPHS